MFLMQLYWGEEAAKDRLRWTYLLTISITDIDSGVLMRSVIYSIRAVIQLKVRVWISFPEELLQFASAKKSTNRSNSHQADAGAEIASCPVKGSSKTVIAFV